MKVYEWDLEPGGSCGASIDKQRAIKALHEALEAAPNGAAGVVQECVLASGLAESRVLRTVHRATRHPETGALVWSDGL